MFQMWMARRSAAAGRVKQMQLLETLPLGGKRQLMLVQCGTEQFLVGGGLESVETIVKLAGTTDTLRQQDDLCG
jgi:flagellar biogenesis protein FliO